MSELGWIGFDWDGTLVRHERSEGFLRSKPVPIEPMMALFKRYIAEGKNVRIVSARACERAGQVLIRRELDYLGITQVIPITNQKDLDMIVLYDDSAKQVVRNEGVLLEDVLGATRAKLEDATADLEAVRAELEATKAKLAAATSKPEPIEQEPSELLVCNCASSKCHGTRCEHQHPHPKTTRCYMCHCGLIAQNVECVAVEADHG